MSRRSRHCLVGVLAAAAATAAAPAPPSSQLQTALQQVMDELASETGFALQLGWKSATDKFSLAAGNYTVPGQKTKQTTVDDTFLFGSGTKPFTSAAVMGLVAKGVVSLDDPLAKHIDGVLGALKPGTTLQSLFGAEAAKITVGHVLRMQSGVADFDVPEFDEEVLTKGGQLKHSPLEFVQFAANQTPPLQFEPGTQVSYSSTNFDLAGFVLLAHAAGGPTTWDKLDITQFFPKGVLGNLKFFSDQTIDEYLTVPGMTGGGWGHYPKLTVWNQSSTILGWTCGNIVGTTGDLASFLWGLLGPEPKVVPAAQVEQMKQFKPLSFGWAKGAIQYGTGLMIESCSRNVPMPPSWDQLGTYMGHGGDTYGFLSEQGIAYGLNASISVIANQDGDGSFVMMAFMCRVIETAAQVLHGTPQNLGCRPAVV